MTEPTDEEMRAQLARSREYTTVLLRPGPQYGAEGSAAIVWEHGRRNFALRAAGTLPIVCPSPGGGELAGIGIMTVPPAEAAALLDADPAVAAGILTYEVHACRGFPGDSLPL